MACSLMGSLDVVGSDEPAGEGVVVPPAGDVECEAMWMSLCCSGTLLWWPQGRLILWWWFPDEKLTEPL